MRVTYRKNEVKSYWANRWNDIPVDEPMSNSNSYPLRYALDTINSRDGAILEAGCGAGRILRYYHDLGYDITGFDFIEVAVQKLKKITQAMQPKQDDISLIAF